MPRKKAVKTPIVTPDAASAVTSMAAEWAATAGAAPDEAAKLANDWLTAEVAKLQPLTPEQLRGEAASTKEPVESGEVISEAIAGIMLRAGLVTGAELEQMRRGDENVAAVEPKPGVRSWSARHEPPEARFERVTGRDERGVHRIAFRFKLERGAEKPLEAFLAVMREQQGSELARAVNFTYRNDRLLGKSWLMDDTPGGRELADRLDAKLHGIGLELLERGKAIG